MGAQTFDFTSTQAAGCAQGALAAGKSGNRVNRVIGATTYSSCFNHADRLVSTTEPGFTGTIAYDTHGNMTTVAGETRSYDITDRHTSTTKGAVTVTYVRDVTDRIVARTDSTGTTRFGFTAGGDSAGLTLTSANVLVERTMGLPGGVMLTTRSSGNVWSYPNWHGDHVATANQAGAKQGGTASYDPFGNLTSGTPVDNGAGALDYGWHGQAQRPLDTTAGLTPTIEMGARQYLSQLGRFIEQDPIEGGVDNDYTYVTDPINNSDLNGMWCMLGTNPNGSCRGSGVVKAVKKVASNPVFQAVAGGIACAATAGACLVVGLGFAAMNIHNRANNMGGWGAAMSTSNRGRFILAGALDIGSALVPMVARAVPGTVNGVVGVSKYGRPLVGPVVTQPGRSFAAAASINGTRQLGVATVRFGACVNLSDTC